ncbi:hypothetical protein QE152_g39880, partial [Popillia japonica]
TKYMRSSVTNLPCEVKQYLNKYRAKNEGGEESAVNLGAKCSLCGWKKNRVTTIQCGICKRMACKKDVVTTHTCLT